MIIGTTEETTSAEASGEEIGITTEVVTKVGTDTTEAGTVKAVLRRTPGAATTTCLLLKRHLNPKYPQTQLQHNKTRLIVRRKPRHKARPLNSPGARETFEGGPVSTTDWTRRCDKTGTFCGPSGQEGDI